MFSVKKFGRMATQNSKSIPFRIAIDGPAGAGKSTLAKSLADSLGFTHINTGIIYRALSYYLLVELKIEFSKIQTLLEEESPEVYDLVSVFSPEFSAGRVYLKGKEITEYLRTPEIDSIVGVIAKYPRVREKVSEIQRELIEKYAIPGVVVEGRDIGTVIIPEAELKIFLIASVQVRAQRRAQEQPAASLKLIEKEIQERDRLDITRHHSPLIQAPDAIIIDNSSLTIAETTQKIKKIALARIDSLQT
ncbi:CMP/dCMP kinase [Nematocida sp. AWRm80]|nr:CMP/dCMP kinase [Nematocida sp. AWRm80]